MVKYIPTPSVVVCPKCDNQFINNRVNGMALVEVSASLEAQKRMHCRLTLDLLERQFGGTPSWPIIKKAVLDGYNDLTRDLHTVLGFGAEAE